MKQHKWSQYTKKEKKEGNTQKESHLWVAFLQFEYKPESGIRKLPFSDTLLLTTFISSFSP